MENFLKTTNSNRYVIEDSFPKVTSDGEPHEMMTLVAGLSGLLAAVVVLSILAALIGCNKPRSQSQNQNNGNVESSTSCEIEIKLSTTLPTLIRTNEKRNLISTITKSHDQTTGINNFGFQSNELTLEPKNLKASDSRLFEKKY